MISTPRNPDPVLAATVGRLLLSDSLVWRHHKIGLLQAYLVEALAPGETETRLHVWHPSLCLSDEDSGRMHDHRFFLTSQVLLGAMHDTEIDLHLEWERQSRPPSSECYQIWNIQNARSAQADGKHWVRLEEGHHIYSIKKTEHVYSMGSTYSYMPRKFHRSDVKELTVTVCTKKLQANSPARLLARLGKEPQHAFDPTPGHGEVRESFRDLLREAGALLLAVARAK